MFGFPKKNIKKALSPIKSTAPQSEELKVERIYKFVQWRQGNYDVSLEEKAVKDVIYPDQKWRLIRNIPHPDKLSLMLKHTRRGSDYVAYGVWKVGRPNHWDVNGEWTYVEVDRVLSPEKEPTPGNWVARVENLCEPYTPEDLKAVREASLVNWIFAKYGEFSFKEGDLFYRVGCKTANIIVKGKEMTIDLPDMVADDSEALGIITKTYTVAPENWVEENAALVYDAIADCFETGVGNTTLIVEDDVDLEKICKILDKKTEGFSFKPYMDEFEDRKGILLSVPL